MFKEINLVSTAKISALAFAAVVAAGTMASAATVTLLGSSAQGASNDAGIGFAVGYGANTPTGATVAGNIVTITPPPGNDNGQYQSPFNSNALTGTQDYFSVGSAGPGTLSFGTAQSSFSLLWGSIDSYNTLSFDNGLSWTGTQIIDALGLTGTAANFEQAAEMRFDFGPNESFNIVTFDSSSNAFEFATAPSPVPVPAALPLLLVGAGALGFVGRRKKKAAKAV